MHETCDSTGLKRGISCPLKSVTKQLEWKLPERILIFVQSEFNEAVTQSAADKSAGIAGHGLVRKIKPDCHHRPIATLI